MSLWTRQLLLNSKVAIITIGHRLNFLLATAKLNLMNAYLRNTTLHAKSNATSFAPARTMSYQLFGSDKFYRSLTLLLLTLLIAGLSFGSQNAWSSDTKTKIERVEIRDRTELIHVITTNPIRNAPSCQTVSKRLIFSTTRSNSKLFLATLLTAISADKPVRLVGTGSCTDRVNIETIQWLSIYR